MEKTVVELFAGVGGFRCGLNKVELKKNKVVENGNWVFVWANQWEPATKTQEAFDCYSSRFGKKDVSNVDIFLVDKKEIPTHTLLVGGFPCQDYSVAKTLSSSKGIKGKKGVLWWAIADILKIKKPPFVFLENVDRLLLSPVSQRGRDFGVILRSFYENGYDVEWRVINAGEYGFQQKRRRIYIIAYHKSTKYYKKIKRYKKENILLKEGIFVKQFPVKNQILNSNISTILEYKDLADVSDNFKNQFYNSGVMVNGKIFTAKLESDCDKVYHLKNLIEDDEVDEKYFLSDERIQTFKILKGSKKILRTKPNGEDYVYAEGSMPFPDKLDVPARTMLTSESSTSRMTHVVEDKVTKKLRLLTPIECEKINGFPKNWTDTGMSERKRYFMMGNALVVNVVEKIGVELEKIIENEE